MHIKNADVNQLEVPFQSTELVSTFEGNSVAILRALMEFYESNPILDEGESEVDLMIQLSGMVYNYPQGDE
ncbi:MAG: hypothetical protein M3Q16_06380 [Pseudomonadota bacterium]|nr:hypothetical protein [Pseudomonadota bacterium]